MDKDEKTPPVSKPGGQPVTIQKTSTLHRQAEELIHSEDVFREAFDNASIGMALGAPDGTFAHTNAAFDRMTGYEPGELIGVHRSAITPPEDIVENEERYRQLVKNGLPDQRCEKCCVRKDGRVIWLDVMVSFIRDREGTVRFSVIMARDITERKQIEEALCESEDKYRSLLEHAYDAIMIADFEGNLLEVNKKAEDLLGYAKEELVGANISKIHPKEEHGRILRAFREMVEGKTHFLSDTKVLTKDGRTIPVDICGGAIGYGGRQVGQAIFRDITDRKKIEEQLADYREHLEKLVAERTNELKRKRRKISEYIRERSGGDISNNPRRPFSRC